MPTNPSIASDLIADHDAALSRVGGFIAFADGLLAAHQINDLRLVHELASKASQLTREVDAFRGARSAIEAARRQWFCSGQDCEPFDHGRDEGFELALKAFDQTLSRSSGRVSDATE